MDISALQNKSVSVTSVSPISLNVKSRAMGGLPTWEAKTVRHVLWVDSPREKKISWGACYGWTPRAPKRYAASHIGQLTSGFLFNLRVSDVLTFGSTCFYENPGSTGLSNKPLPNKRKRAYASQLILCYMNVIDWAIDMSRLFVWFK